MNGNIVLDTNILIYLSKKQLDLKVLFQENTRYSISVITKIELLGYHFKEEEELRIINGIINALNVIPLTDEIVKLTIALRKKAQNQNSGRNCLCFGPIIKRKFIHE